MRRDMNKSEIRSTKYETSSNDQNPNDQNNRTCTFQVPSFLSFENSNLSSFVSNFDIRDSDFQAMISHRIGRTSPGPPPEVEVLEKNKPYADSCSFTALCSSVSPRPPVWPTAERSLNILHRRDTCRAGKPGGTSRRGEDRRLRSTKALPDRWPRRPGR